VRRLDAPLPPSAARKGKPQTLLVTQ